MLSDVSDLTDLSSDDNFGPSIKTKNSTKKTAYRLRNVLKPGRTTQYTAKALYDQIQDKDIKLDPEYQRDVVWSEAKQIGLVDSIFRNFYVPPIIFAVTTEDDGTEKWEATIDQYFKVHRRPDRDPFTNEKLWFVDSKSGPKRKLLPPQYKTLFQNKQIVCIEYSDLPPDLEREVFQRVQMGMALTTAEKLQAISGPWPDLVREISNQYYLGSDGLSVNMDLDRARARDFQNLAQTLYCIDQLPDRHQGTTMQLEKWLTREERPSEATRNKMHDVFRVYKDLARHKQLKIPFKQPVRVAPAEFIMTGVMIAMFKDSFSLPQLSQAVGILRNETRAVHTDVRANSKVFNTMFHVISKQIKLSTLKPTPGVPTAGIALAIQPSATSIPKPRKRKRDETSEGGISDGEIDELEYIPPPSGTRVLGSIQTSPAKLASNVSSTTSGIKVEETRSTLPPSPLTHSSNSFSRPPPTGPSGVARIHAAKAQAAMMSSGSGSRPSSSTPISGAPQYPFPPVPLNLPPRPENLPHQIDSSLEAKMMGIDTQQTYPPPPHPLPQVPFHAASQHIVTPSASLAAPVPTTNGDHQLSFAGNSRLVQPTNNGYRQEQSPLSSKDDRSDGGNHRGNHRYDERRDRENELNSRDRGKGDIPRGQAGGSYSRHGDPYSRPRDSGWERKSDNRDSRDYYRSSGYHGR